MVLDIAIYHTADVLIREHGPVAPIHAAMQADKMLEAGVRETAATGVWAIRSWPTN